MYKKSVSLFVVLLLVLSPLTLAADEEDTCTGFSWLKCLLFGDADKRPVAGSAWYDRGLPWYDPEGESLVGDGRKNV